MAYTLITGASGYLGRAFALECISRGDDLFLTGRSDDKLKELACYLKTVNQKADVITYACDLTSETERKRMYDFADGLTFKRLINVAGADIQKGFECYTEDKLTFQLRVCLEAAISLCHFAIKHKDNGLKIINISSVSGIYPMPYFAVYSAAKGALTSFSLALNQEMKGKNVTVTAVLPGSIYTRADVIEYIKTQGVWGRIAAKTPDYVCLKSLKASDKGRAKVIIGNANKFMNIFTKLVPLSLKLKFISSKWRKTTKDAF